MVRLVIEAHEGKSKMKHKVFLSSTLQSRAYCFAEKDELRTVERSEAAFFNNLLKIKYLWKQTQAWAQLLEL